MKTLKQTSIIAIPTLILTALAGRINSVELLDSAVFLINTIPAIGGLFFLKKKNRENLASFLEKLSHLKMNINGTNSQFFDSCAQLDETTNEQASAVVETSATSDEISAMITKTTDSINSFEVNIREISNYITTSDQSLGKLECNIRETIDSSREINKTLHEIVRSLNGFLSTFTEVESKALLINDIVFQTKLLSFNASVEAARAGEHGKGFSVVAEEIGKLATTSGNSANAINDTLAEAQEKLNLLITRIEESSGSLTQRLDDISNTCDTTLEEFKNNFSKATNETAMMNHQVAEVTVASKEQQNGVIELRDAIHSINNSTQRNTLVVSQTLNLADILNSYLKDLDKSIDTIQKKNHISIEQNIAQIPWEDKYSIGINEMDNEHKELLRKINTLIKAMNTNKGITKAFNDLKEYTLYHFEDEEKLMREINYPSYESHKRVHEKLVSNVLKFESQLMEGKLDRAQLASFLKNWLFTHIMGIDVKYAAHHEQHNKRFAA